MGNTILKMDGITKQFPGVLALDKASFELTRGEVHALLGINGAGKSTLIKVLSGINQIEGGKIWIDGKAVEIDGTTAARKLGVATVYQAPEMVPSFSGYENVFLGNESTRSGFFSYIDRQELRRHANEVLKQFPIDVDLDRPVSELAPIEREAVSILRALVLEDIKILILDEPTSILSHREIQILFSLIRSLKEQGVSIIYVTHNLNEVFEITDRFTVFRAGQNVGTFPSDKATYSHNDIAELMLGNKLQSVYPEASESYGETLFAIEDLAYGQVFEDVTFEVRRNEIVGIFGLVGSGLDELCKTMFGDLRADTGEIRIAGVPQNFRSCADAIDAGIFLVPADRHTEGYFSDESIAFNTTISNLPGVSSRGIVRRKAETNATLALIDELKLAPGDPHGNISKLSGGNQQKAVMAKGFFTDSSVYIFAEPTVGVDIGAKALIYHAIRDLSTRCATIVASSDVEEVYGIADRILVVYEGKVVLNATKTDVSLDDVLVCGLTGEVPK